MMLQHYQQSNFNLEMSEPIYTFLEALPALEDKELWEISNYLEPRKKKKTTRWERATSTK